MGHFLLIYRDQREFGAFIIKAKSLADARTTIAHRVEERSFRLAHELDAELVALVPSTQIGRSLSANEVKVLLMRFEDRLCKATEQASRDMKKSELGLPSAAAAACVSFGRLDVAVSRRDHVAERAQHVEATGHEMIKRHPIEANFYANVSEVDVEVIFAPTHARYTFRRLFEHEETAGLLHPEPFIQNAGRSVDTRGYSPEEVQAIAYRVALATVRRLRRSAPRAPRW